MRSLLFSAAMALAWGSLASLTNWPSSPDVPQEYLAGFTNASVQYSIGGQAVCVSGTISVTASANNSQILSQEPANQTVVTELVVEFLQINSTLAQRYVGGKNPISGTYGIYSQLCFPVGKPIDPSTIQFLIHGVGFDRTYWNVAEGYSYVDYVASQGYSTFFYDRLGIGLSDHPDPIQVVQAPLEVAIAHELVQTLRAGGIANTSFENVVGVGHSFGSIQMIGLTSQFPTDLDAAVLTGFSTSMTGMPIFFAGLDLTIASQNQPARFSTLPNGYLVSNSIVSNQFGFFRAQNFDPQLLSLGEVTKQTFTVGEFFTISSIVTGPSAEFTGPIDVVDGENDLPFCQGNCLLPVNQAAAVKAALFPAASSSSQYYIAPGAGHGLNLHYAATGAYEQIQSFVKAAGL